MRLKKLDSGVSFKLPIALAAFLNAILSLLLPLGTLWLNTLPPLILLLGSSLSQLANCFAYALFYSYSAVAYYHCCLSAHLLSFLFLHHNLVWRPVNTDTF